jgi:hypothetical protein
MPSDIIALPATDAEVLK